MYRSVPKGSGPAGARFNQLKVVRYTPDVGKAIGHSASRNERVVQAACFFSLIRSTTPNLGAARVLVEAAQRRLFSSREGYEAAHYLPCQLTIQASAGAKAELPWNYVPNPNARQRLEYLFADVEHLPAAFNKADSAAEAKGLRETFRLLGENILGDPMAPTKGVANKTLIRRLYDEIWAPGALESYNAAIAQKTLVCDVPPIEYDEEGNIKNLTERGTADWSRDDEVAILQRYSEALRTPPSELSDGKITKIESLFAG
jgi:hypothetical protein